MLLDAQQHLVAAAQAACERSYSPYSGLRVGASLLTGDGQVFSGTNIENASYSATICAERAALAAAVSQGHRTFIALALTFGGKGISVNQILPPCGICLQTLAEFARYARRDIEIVMVSADGSKQVMRKLSELLPLAMTLEAS